MSLFRVIVTIMLMVLDQFGSAALAAPNPPRSMTVCYLKHIFVVIMRRKNIMHHYNPKIRHWMQDVIAWFVWRFGKSMLSPCW